MAMNNKVSAHYSGSGGLAESILGILRNAGNEPSDFDAAILEAIDEFHFRGKGATRELLPHMKLTRESTVLDIGSGFGGTARTIAGEIGCKVTGVDLTQELCNAATAISEWIGLSEKTEFIQGDATSLPFKDSSFDGATTIHAAMNIPGKDKMYAEAHRVLKSGARFVIYDILQGEGGDVMYPAPWAQEPEISHLATPHEMVSLLAAAGFKILQEIDSTHESLDWIEARTAKKKSESQIVTTQILFGNEAQKMTQNQICGLRERRMLTYTIVCQA